MHPLAVPSARARCRHKLSDLIAHPDSSAQPEQPPQPKAHDGQPIAVPGNLTALAYMVQSADASKRVGVSCPQR